MSSDDDVVSRVRAVYPGRGPMYIPTKHIVMPTEGSERSLQQQAALHRSKLRSICLAFQKGVCGAGGRCHQIHVNRAWFLSVSSWMHQERCCVHHDHPEYARLCDQATPHELELHYSGHRHRRAGNKHSRRNNKRPVILRLHSSHFAPTAPLLRPQSSSSPTIITPNAICQLHVRGACTFAGECGHYHLCHGLYAWYGLGKQRHGFPAARMQCLSQAAEWPCRLFVKPLARIEPDGVDDSATCPGHDALVYAVVAGILKEDDGGDAKREP